MTELIYLEDSYLKEFHAKVLEVVNERFVVLDKTIFYVQGGGQLCDLGEIISGGVVYRVISVKKNEGRVVLHEVDKIGLNISDKVHLKIDWERRYKMMRMHTAAHLFCAVLNKHTGALITGNQLDLDKSRIDFSLEIFDREAINNYFTEANQLISDDREVKFYTLPREEAMKIPGVVKLANALPPSVSNLRIVEILGVDIQADGGTHVKGLKEIGRLELVSAENKGAKNRRIYFTVV